MSVRKSGHPVLDRSTQRAQPKNVGHKTRPHCPESGPVTVALESTNHPSQYGKPQQVNATTSQGKSQSSAGQVQCKTGDYKYKVPAQCSTSGSQKASDRYKSMRSVVTPLRDSSWVTGSVNGVNVFTLNWTSPI
ncbi:hypothetical protein FIBSPDRAFT_892999 [Athelia psychrophila]|uniref:Uncharacterized protein n=1 Tax=Athelia psychrophila TaxID=1759441 RepID=A0A166HL75_9AGAM|nr:hypothetical protein FIBSPDRAFT_892999 [Fibularhizoctonia sp. CBS 109695]